MRSDLMRTQLSNRNRSGAFIRDGLVRWGAALSVLLGVTYESCGSDGMGRGIALQTPFARAEDDRPRISAVIGSCGAKVKSTVIADLSAVLRSAILKELRSSPLLRVFEESRNASLIGTGYSIDGSVTQLTRHYNSQGDLEVSADVSLIISALPGRRVVGMVSGGATVIGSATADSQFATLLLQSLQQEAIQHAVHEATTSWIDSLDRKGRRNKSTKLVAQAHSVSAVDGQADSCL